MNINTQYNDCANDDGISVFDVTVLGHPKYAMLQLGDYEEYYETNTAANNVTDAFNANTILNASDYMLRYGRDASDLGNNAYINTLDALPQVDVATLKRTWPQGDFKSREGTHIQDSITDASSLGNTVNSLTESSMRTVIEKAMKGDLSNVKWLTEAEQVPGFTKSLHAYLYAHPEAVDGRPASQVLGHVLKGCAIIDLSSFCLLSFEDVLAIVDIMAASGNLSSLTLPDLEDLTTSDVGRLLSNGLIYELHVGSHQIGSLGEITDAIDGTSVTSFTVTELYARSLVPIDNSPAAIHREFLELRDRESWTAWQSPLPSLPHPRQFPITQLLFVQWPAARMAPASICGDFVVP